LKNRYCPANPHPQKFNNPVLALWKKKLKKLSYINTDLLMNALTKILMNAHKKLTTNLVVLAVYFLSIHVARPSSYNANIINKIVESLKLNADVIITENLELTYYRELCLSRIMPTSERPTQEELDMANVALDKTAIAEDYPKGDKSYYKVLKASNYALTHQLLIFTTKNTLHLLQSTKQRHPETPRWIDFDPLGMEGSRWLMFARITDPLDSPQCAFRFELTDDVYGVYRILQDNRLNRIGEDADAVFEDLVALKNAHAAGTLKDAPPALKTNFAKAVLARLLEQAAQPEQSNSEPSEVGRQAAE
jgi:hypothetical protein